MTPLRMFHVLHGGPDSDQTHGSHQPRSSTERGSGGPRFGGCNRLLGQYRIIGQELERFMESFREQSLSPYRDKPSAESIKMFREGVAFIPTEVLSSYREDLLDPSVSVEHLFLTAGKWQWGVPVLAALGVVGAMVFGLLAASSGASFLLSFSLTFAVAAPFMGLWHFSPRDGMFRRLKYSEWLDQEITRRSGDGRTTRRRDTSGIFAPLWPRQAHGSF